MDLNLFKDLPDQSRLWIMGFSRPLGERGRQAVSAQLESFLPTWNAHQIPVTGAFTLVEDRFAVVAGDAADGLSGCSMDSCMANFKQLKRAGYDALNRALVFYRLADGSIQAADRLTFVKKAESGEIDDTTRVFDTTLQTLGELRRAKGFEKPLADSWHARLLPARSV
ncbi:MAG TPA: hypothetical protein VLU25_14005 [Acidobacteriota bacterium]|nr:hypothetical protein [Acidobacteriota bacterium]